MNFSRKVLALCLSISVCLGVNAQESTRVVEGVILFQSESHLVRMTEKGKILAFLKKVDNSYSSLNSITSKDIVMEAVAIENAPDLGRVSISQPGNIDMQEEDATEVMAVNENEVMNITQEEDMEQEVVVNTIRPDEDLMAKGEPKDKSYDFDFSFDHRDASLSPSVVNQLSQVAKILKEDNEAKAEIKSYYSETVDISKVLSKNRAKGIQDQLVANGISRDRISISETNNEDWSNNRVKLSIY